jgi:radical SAM superfamily enzyme YgiQ (UPF0313 family)
VKRLLLIQPSKYLEIEGGFYGLATLATYVENQCQVKIYDQRYSLATTVKDFDPDIVGITASTLSYSRAIQIMKVIRLLAPKALRIIGGPHISCLPESLDPIFDLGVIGDGEETLLEIIQVAKKEDLVHIPGTCRFEGDQVKITHRYPINLEKVPIPKLHIYAPYSYKHGIIGFITSRGCPFSCVFCYSKVMRKGVSNHPIKWIADHFEYATKDLKAKYIVLWDDNICLNIDRLTQLAEELERRQIRDFELSVNLRSSTISEELCILLQRLHVRNCFSGFESGSDKVLKAIKGKDASISKHKETMKLTNKYGINLTVNFMLGMPEEKIDDMEKTYEFIDYMYKEKHAGRFRGRVCVNMAIPFPGTCWWKIAKTKGVVSDRMDWKQLKNNPESVLLLDPKIRNNDWIDICRKTRAKVEKNGDIIVWT